MKTVARKKGRKPETYAVVMAGGNGERFWPLSTPAKPKQFLTLFGGKPLIRHAVDRLAGLIPPERVLVVTADRFVRLTREALPVLPKGNVIGEPCRRNTAAAVAVACREVRLRAGEDAVVCVLTADQLIRPAAAFRKTLRQAITVAASEDSIVTIGIEPTYPATGFGYIEWTAERPRFVEKPDAATAEEYVKSGRFCWNSGMFIFRERVMEAAIRREAPAVAALFDAADVRAAYPGLPSISIDYAVMEKADNIRVVRSAFEWDDVGSYMALGNHFPADEAGNVRLGRTAAIDTRNSVVVSDKSHVIAVFGMDDVVVVHTPGATLVCPKSRLGDMRKLTAAIRI